MKYSAEQDTAQLLDPKGINMIQSIVGTFLYYGIAIDNTILPALGEIAAEQSTTTKKCKKVTQILNYLTTNPNATIKYYANVIILYHLIKDVAELVEYFS